MSDTGVFILRAEDETVSVALDSVTSVRRAGREPIPAATIEVRRSKRAAELKELEFLRGEVARLRRALAEGRD